MFFILAKIGDHLPFGQEVHQGLRDNCGGVAEVQEGEALQEGVHVCVQRGAHVDQKEHDQIPQESDGVRGQEHHEEQPLELGPLVRPKSSNSISWLRFAPSIFLQCPGCRKRGPPEKMWKPQGLSLDLVLLRPSEDWSH